MDTREEIEVALSAEKIVQLIESLSD